MADLIPIVIPVEVAVSNVQIPVEVSVSKMVFPAEVALAYYTSEYEQYTGETEFTPSEEEQVIQTAERVLMDNLTIDPIPSNYGLITWDGTVITVS